MAWLNRVSFTNFADIAGAVNKISESVKNIEKNFDSALGFEEKRDADGNEERTFFDPITSLTKQKEADDNSVIQDAAQSSKTTALQDTSDWLSAQSPPESVLKDIPSQPQEQAQAPQSEEDNRSQQNESPTATSKEEGQYASSELDQDEHSSTEKELEQDSHLFPSDVVQTEIKLQEVSEVALPCEVEEHNDPQDAEADHSEGFSKGNQLIKGLELVEGVEGVMTIQAEEKTGVKDLEENVSHGGVAFQQSGDNGYLDHGKTYASVPSEPEPSNISSTISNSNNDSAVEAINNIEADTVDKPHALKEAIYSGKDISDSMVFATSEHTKEPQNDADIVENHSELLAKQDPSLSLVGESDSEVQKLRAEMKMMEAAVQGAARQSQAKADEIARLLIENEQLKNTIEDLKRKSPEAETDALRDEYQQRLGALERKVYALTKERDTLRREQSRKSDSAVLLKEKDEIIKQVMAEGEELSKKQAAQEAQMRKLRAQIRELEEEKQRLNSKLQVEEAKVESIRKDKAATEKALQEAVENSQAELAAQKEFYTKALNEAKEAEALAEARGNNEAKTELEHRLHEAGECEAALVQALEELRETLSKSERQAASQEDKLRSEIDHLQKRCQATEMRYEELVLRVPESTRPLLRQIEAMQETAAMRSEAWSGVERTLNARVQEAEAKAASAEERERAMNERLTQTLSRMAVLEAQVSCLRAEQAQLTRSLEKERQRAAENRQEYLAALETAASEEGRAKQLEDEIKELRIQHKNEMVEEMARRELLEQELERERTTRLDLEKTARPEAWSGSEKNGTSKYTNSYLDHGVNNHLRRFSSAGSANSMEESFDLRASLDSSSEQALVDRRSTGELAVSTYYGKSFMPTTLENFEATLRQKDGELSSYMARLASLESIRDSLAEELVKMTNQCERLSVEVAALPGLKAELEALRRRHTSALELMGERDEELEELRADVADVKQMYREQVDMLVSQIERLSSSLGSK